jgi:glycerate 2-kinase
MKDLLSPLTGLIESKNGCYPGLTPAATLCRSLRELVDPLTSAFCYDTGLKHVELHSLRRAIMTFREFNMPNLTQLRMAAREIFDDALRGVDAGAAVRRAIHLEGSQLKVCDETIYIKNRKIYSIAIGKAAIRMASALEDILGESLTGALIAGKDQGNGIARNVERIKSAQVANLRHMIFRGGHPEPNEQSLAAAQACFNLLERANKERALLIFLISGGGSAMMEWPIDESITLSDLHAANKALVGCGASISEINAVRRGFSAIKGGRLAARAPHCDQITFIISDVPTGEERNVASGPTFASPSNAPDAGEVISRYDLRSRLPETILRAIQAGAPPPESAPMSLRPHFVLLDNRSALEAAAEAAKRRGFVTKIANDISDQPVEVGCTQLLSQLKAFHASTSTADSADSVCLISGGEFACPVKGDGIGGRNQETALRLARGRSLTSSGSEQLVAICGGTDGIDGNSPAAGAIVDSTTIDRAQAIGLDPADFIERSDAYSFFVALGDTIATGATGTNVRDLRLLLQSRSQ